MKRLENLMGTIARSTGAVFAPLRPIGEGRRLPTAAVALIIALSASTAHAAQAPAQAWPTAISGGGSDIGTTRTFSWQSSPYGNPGVSATQTITSRVAAPTACAFMSGTVTGASMNAIANVTTFIEPDFPAGALLASNCTLANNGFVSSFVFNKPLIAPIFHFYNLDASRFSITGTSTTSAAIGLTTIVKNNLLDISGTTLNNTVQTATAIGCNNNTAGDTGNGACGSFRVTAASGLIGALTLNNNATPSAGVSNDGFNWTISFPTAPLTKQFSPTNIFLGQTSQLVFSIANPNQSASVTLTPLDFTDNLPTGVTLASATATNNGSCGSPAVTNGSGGMLAVGATSVRATNISVAPGVTCTITVVVTAAQTGSYTNNTSNMSSGVGNLIPNGSTTLAVTESHVDLAITKDDGETTYAPGLDTTYAITVTNSGPDAVIGAQVSDPLPVGITNASWVCTAIGGGVCGAASGTGGINTTANLPIGASVTYALTVAIPGSFTGNLSNTATVAAPVGVTDTNLANNTASDTNTMEVPPTSTACSPRSVVQNDSFTLAPLPITGTVQKTATSWQPAPNGWATLGGNYTLRWTFSQPIPANWVQFGIVDIDANGAQVTVSLGAGSTATIGQLTKVSGALLLNASGVVSRDTALPQGQSGVFRFASTGTITSISLVSAGVLANDNIANPLFVRPACVTMEKVSQGDTGSFTFQMTNVADVGGTAVTGATLTTTAPGTAVSSPDYFSSSPGTAMTLGEVVPQGWAITSAVCTDQNAGGTGNPTVVSSFASPTITIPAGNVRPEADIVCRFENGQLPTLNLTKTTRWMAGGPFGFTLGNTTMTALAPVTTSAADNAVVVDGDAGPGTAFSVSNLGADVTIDESSLPAGWIVDATTTTCTNVGGAVVGGLSNGVYTIPAGSIAVGETYACNFVNSPTTNLRIDKAVSPAAARTGEPVTYTLTLNNDGPGPGNGAVVTDPAIPGVDCTAGTLTCSGESGGAVCPVSPNVADLQSTGLTIPVLPVGGSLQLTLACAVTASGAP